MTLDELITCLQFLRTDSSGSSQVLLEVDPDESNEVVEADIQGNNVVLSN